MPQGKKFDKEKILESLRPYFLMGLSIEEACDESKISNPTTIYKWCVSNPTIKSQIAGWQNFNTLKSNQNITEAIKQKDKEISKWWLENRKGKYFRKQTRNENENTGEQSIIIRHERDYNPTES